MSGASAGAAAAAAAAAEQRRRQEEEEEQQMTGYSPHALGGEWEFKILRSVNGAFRKPDLFRQALEEESHAGWTLVEKFDNARIRLKRPVSAKQNDASLQIDAYRTYFGRTEGEHTALVLTWIFGGIIFALLLVI